MQTGRKAPGELMGMGELGGAAPQVGLLVCPGQWDTLRGGRAPGQKLWLVRRG